MNVIEKTLALMETFLHQDGFLTLDEMARLTGLNKTTVRRIAVTLVKNGYLKQPEKRGRYSLGMRFLDFAKAVKSHNQILDIAAPHLFKLSQKVDETVALAVWDGNAAVICQKIHPSHPLKVISNEGRIMDLHFTSLGKAILAFLPENQLEKMYAGGLHRSTPNTITDLNDLKKHLLVVKQRGFAFDDEEFSLGIRGAAAVFYDENGTVAGAVSVLGPSVRLTRDRLQECAEIVKKCADLISTELGFKAGPVSG